MIETKFPGYYVTEDGEAYREPTCKRDYTLIEQGKYETKDGRIRLSTFLRGHPRYPEHRYKSINVSHIINGKFHKQTREYIHHLIAKTLVDNPNNLPEIDHVDGDRLNNHRNNLEWVTHQENMDRYKARNNEKVK